MSLCAIALAACGGGSSSTSHRTVESPQGLPSLPKGWRRHVDVRRGVAIGVPPGWRVRRRTRALLVTSPGQLVAVSVTATRTGSALSVPLGRFAHAVPGALSGYPRPPQVGGPKPFRGTPLRAVRVRAKGVAANGVPERVTVVALRRDHLATFTLVAVANPGAPASVAARAMAVARTLRDRPVHQPAGRRSGRSG